MRHPVLDAIFLIAACALSPWASAQNAYKCGNTYSQTPCPGAVPVAIDDSRTSAQQKQTDAATAMTSKTASTLEKDRLAQEKRDLAANKPALPVVNSSVKAPTDEPPKTSAKKKKKKGEPEYFTAQVPGEKKTKAKAKEAKASKAKKEAASKT